MYDRVSLVHFGLKYKYETVCDLVLIFFLADLKYQYHCKFGSYSIPTFPGCTPSTFIVLRTPLVSTLEHKCVIIPFSALSTIFIAIVMKGQHCSQILAPLKQEDMFNNNFGLGIKITAKYLALNAVFIIKFRYFASKLSPCMYKLQGCIRLYKFVNLALLFTQYENWIISYAKNIDKS